MYKIALFNLKGGIGKTTTATALAAILGRKGYRVLLVDADFQHNSTTVYRGKIDDEYTLYNVLGGGESCSASDAVQHTEFGDLIAGDDLLCGWEKEMTYNPDAVFKLDEQLSALDRSYDFAIIDTHPSRSMLEESVLTAADSVIIPGFLDNFTADGIIMVCNYIMEIKQFKNPGLTISGFLAVCCEKRNALQKFLDDEFREVMHSLGTKMFDSTIRKAAIVGKSQNARMPLVFYSSKCDVEKDYEAFADEFLKDIGMEG